MSTILFIINIILIAFSLSIKTYQEVSFERVNLLFDFLYIQFIVSNIIVNNRMNSFHSEKCRIIFLLKKVEEKAKGNGHKKNAVGVCDWGGILDVERVLVKNEHQINDRLLTESRPFVFSLVYFISLYRNRHIHALWHTTNHHIIITLDGQC